ncbi:MAG: sulfatase-like hydrolase/transferase [Pyrinomonadaceae bacterium]
MKPFTIGDPQIRRLAAVFTLFLFVFEVYVVGVNYSRYFVYLLDNETVFFLVIAVLCWLASFYLCFHFICFALMGSWPYRVICLAVFSASIFVEYGYQKALGRFSDRIDIETAMAATPEQQVASIAMYLSWVAVVPCVVFLILLILYRSEKPRGLKHLLLANGLMIAAFALFPVIVDQKFETLSLAAFYRTTTDFLLNGPVMNGKWGSAVTGVELKRRVIRQPTLPAGQQPDNNVIIVVDESVMGDHFSLNGYARPTTPLFDDLASKGILHNWGIAAAASTGSRFTYSALVAGLSPDDFPDRTEFKVNTFPTLFQYAKSMNYKTYFFDGQMLAYWGGIDDDKNYIDHWQGVLDVSDHMPFETWGMDNLIAAKVHSIIYASSGNFIFIFKHGSHIPYQSNFPPDQQVWSPSYTTANKFDIPSGDRLPEVVNAYDNSIKYNVNSFFHDLVDDYRQIPNKSVIIYTGDHGQTLFAGGRSSHGGNTKGEATVPLLIIGTLDAKVDASYTASHQNIFPTVLDLMHYPDELRDHISAPSLLKAKSADSRPRFFNPDLGYKIPFD